MVVDPLARADCPFVGGRARTLEAMDVAHAALAAAANPVVPVMTSLGDLFGRVLPKEWPIIEV